VAKRAKLKAPFPYFGGKSAVAALVWNRIGDVDNYIEPFCGSAAVLLARPHAPRIETVNDADCMVANFWRATKEDAEAVAEFADWPVNEADLHSRHRWLVLSDEAKEFRRRMRQEPDYFDAKVAGWWCWGLCCWIGGGWCTQHGETGEGKAFSRGENQAPCKPDSLRGVHAKGENPAEWNQVPRMGDAGLGMDAQPGLSPGRKPRIDGGEGQYGHGIHAKGDDRVKGLREKVPGMIGGTDARGVNGQTREGRPQLADAYSRGRGVNGNDAAGTCDQRRAWLVAWFGRLRDRLRTVRVCCGDWLRVCYSKSVTTRLGITGVFFDPPYSSAAGRDMKLYAVDCGKVAHDVRGYCLERGPDPRYRIALAGYAGEGHEELERAGWEVVAWASQGGYGNRSVKGKANAKKERLWFSPGTLKAKDLFDDA
jgi:hypothetical protein